MGLMKNTTIGVIALAAVFVSGLLVGVVLPWGGGSQAAEPPPETEAAADADHPNVVILTREQRQLLGLRLGRATVGPYRKSLHFPGSIAEKPGRSNHVVSTAVNGIVTKVYALPGQAVKPGDPLFDVQLTGEALATAQSELLGVLKQIEVTEAELERITPLARDGGVAGKQKLDLEYKLKELAASRDVRSQELLVRGLSATQIDGIVSTGTLLRDFTVTVPDFIAAETPQTGVRVDARMYAIEDLKAYPGLSVRPGDDLCHLAWHTELYVKGHAFEQEIDALNALDSNNWTASIEIGQRGYEKTLQGFQILYVDNHVDPKTQTFQFYVPIQNEILTETRDDRGQLFRSWRFKPGLRVHIRVPLAEVTGHFPLPAEAVAEDGVSAVVFRQLVHEHKDEEGEAHDHGTEMEFEPIPVKILERDAKIVLIDAGGELRPGDSIALNRAYQLQVALKSDSGDGGHDHHGHAH